MEGGDKKGTQSMNDPAYGPAHRPILWGRILCLVGVVGISVCFFLPRFRYSFVTGNGQPEEVIVKPFGDIRHILDLLNEDSLWNAHGYDDLFFLLSAPLSDLLPYLGVAALVPVLASRMARRLSSPIGVGRFLAWVQVTVALLLLSAATVLEVYNHQYVNLEYRVTSLIVPVGTNIAALIFALVALVRCRLPRKAAAALLAFGVLALADHLDLCLYRETEDVLYGGWLYLAAGGLLTLGAVIDWFQSRPAKDAAVGR